MTALAGAAASAARAVAAFNIKSARAAIRIARKRAMRGLVDSSTMGNREMRMAAAEVPTSTLSINDFRHVARQRRDAMIGP